MIDVGNNFGKINLCPLACIACDDQEHIFQCKELINDPEATKNINYKDIRQKCVFSTNFQETEERVLFMRFHTWSFCESALAFITRIACT